jgi:tRNA(Ile)-lysidine synthase TilS/MesJ
LPVVVERVEVGPGSVEAAARGARRAGNGPIVSAPIGSTATAPDDQAETVLMRLLDGTGVRGLPGFRRGIAR